jgi:hypothetical protein
LISALFWVLSRGRAPTYRPSREQVLALLQGVLDKRTSAEQWDLFVSLPIRHDPELDRVRRRCLALSEGDEDHSPVSSGLGGYLFCRDGRERIADIIEELRQVIASEPAQREF